MALHSMGDHHGYRKQCRSSRAVEQGKLVGQKASFKLKNIWALRVRLQIEGRVRELALFNLGIDSKLRGCDLVGLKVRDVCHGDQVAARAIVVQHKTQRPVQFEITPAARDAVQAWIELSRLKPEDYLFPSRLHESPHLGTRQYARILGHWVDELGLDRAEYGTHSMRRTLPVSLMRLSQTVPPPRRSRRATCPASRRSLSEPDMNQSSRACESGRMVCWMLKVVSTSFSRPRQSGTRVSLMIRSARSKALAARARCCSEFRRVMTSSVTNMRSRKAAAAGSMRRR